MKEPMIQVFNLKKTYHIPVRNQGLLASFHSLIHPQYRDVKAVDDINFEIRRGEIVGLIGSNGAGKTTTLKMLTGLLYPTSGMIKVDGFTPHQRSNDYLKKISLVMGNKSQLNQSITVQDSFYITKEIYHIKPDQFKQQLDELVELLELSELLQKLPRNLSLGERAKCEFANALLYQPEILFLDEPTLGMDVSIQLRLRKFIKEYHQKHGTTIIITSHYMADITSLCSRILMINKGELIYNGNLDELSAKILPFKLLKVTTEQPFELSDLPNTLHADLIENENLTYTLRSKKDEISKLTSYLLENFTINDLTIENPSIDMVIDQVYQGGCAI
ncbi:MAG: ATP-binding cassette domain-containing protein [Clostridiales bacterium]|nr:ATP-binding cassette domain-containing protein [Clostridiales bacterium]